MNNEIKLNKEVKKILFLLNQVFEIENKVNKLEENNSINRNIKKLKEFFEETFNEQISFLIENPIGEKYNETRTDVEANISGDSTEDLVIVDVIKPIIRMKQGKINQIIQKAIVVVETKKGEENE